MHIYPRLHKTPIFLPVSTSDLEGVREKDDDTLLEN
jgi:hypothetical protein